MTDQINHSFGVPAPGSVNRRRFIGQSSALTGFLLMPPLLAKPASMVSQPTTPVVPPGTQPVTLRINRKAYQLTVEPRETLLDVLRERLKLTGSKKGCDHGQCGACTVHVDGRQANACLLLAIMQQGQDITTIEGLAESDGSGSAGGLHPLQAAFIRHDGFQCGFCTPGQIMSGVAVLREGHANSRAEIREWMSGNICRCGAYAGIVDAIESVKKGGTPG